MPTTATVNIGHIYPDHSVPPGAVLVMFKYCEACGRPFARRLGTSIYVCGGCRHGMIMAGHIQPVDDADYRAQLPDERVQRHAHHLPHYDDSTVITAKRRRQHATATGYGSRAAMLEGVRLWKQAVRAEFALRGRLTMEQICDVIPGCLTPASAYARCYAAGFDFVIVGHAPHRGACTGKGPAIYEWPGVSPATELVAVTQ